MQSCGQDRTWTAVMLLVLWITACSDGDPPRWGGVVDTVAGVPVVRNPAEPLQEPGEVRLEPVWTQTGPATGAVWERPLDVVAGDDAVFVLDRLAARVYRLDPATGAQELAFGRPGGGPGELGRPSDLALLGGQPLVMDQQENHLERFSADGQPLDGVRLNAIVFGIHPLGGDSLLATAFGTETLLNVVVGDSFRTVPEPDPVTGVEAGLDRCRRFSTFDTLVVRLSCIRPWFQAFDTHGRVDREVLVDRAPEERDGAELEAYVASVRQTLAESGQPADVIDRFAADQREEQRLRRPWQRVRRDSDTGAIVLLEQESPGFGEGPATLHMFDPDGIYIAAVPMQERWIDFVLLEGDIIALVQAPDTGLIRAVRYRRVGLAG